MVNSGLSKCSDAGMVLSMPCSVRGDPWRLLSRDPPMPDPDRSTLSYVVLTDLRGGPDNRNSPINPMPSAGKPTGSSWAGKPLPDPLHQIISMHSMTCMIGKGSSVRLHSCSAQETGGPYVWSTKLLENAPLVSGLHHGVPARGDPTSWAPEQCLGTGRIAKGQSNYSVIQQWSVCSMHNI